MDWKAFDAKIAHLHRDHPQRAKLAELAVAQIREGMQHLHSLGHAVSLVEAPPEAPLEWPKMVYHAQQGQRIVHSNYELDELGPGWYDHPAKAAEMEGHDYQFAARGGVASNAKPPAPLAPQGEVKTSAQLAKEEVPPPSDDEEAELSQEELHAEASAPLAGGSESQKIVEGFAKHFAPGGAPPDAA